MDPEFQAIQQQLQEENGWNLEVAFDPNQILMEPLDSPFPPPLESEPEDPDSI